MIIYTFNNSENKLLSMEPEYVEEHYGYIYCEISRKSDVRKDKYKDWIKVSPVEKEVRYKTFWLSKPNKALAKRIQDEYLERKKKY